MIFAYSLCNYVKVWETQKVKQQPASGETNLTDQLFIPIHSMSLQFKSHSLFNTGASAYIYSAGYFWTEGLSQSLTRARVKAKQPAVNHLCGLKLLKQKKDTWCLGVGVRLSEG